MPLYSAPAAVFLEPATAVFSAGNQYLMAFSRNLCCNWNEEPIPNWLQSKGHTHTHTNDCQVSMTKFCECSRRNCWILISVTVSIYKICLSSSSRRKLLYPFFSYLLSCCTSNVWHQCILSLHIQRNFVCVNEFFFI